MIRQLCSGLRHTPGPAPGAKATALAAESQQLVVAAILAAQAQKAVGQDAASEEGVELFLDELRQVGAGSVFGLDEERRSMLLHRQLSPGRARLGDSEDRLLRLEDLGAGV
jgi:hypothetical protein